MKPLTTTSIRGFWAVLFLLATLAVMASNALFGAERATVIIPAATPIILEMAPPAAHSTSDPANATFGELVLARAAHDVVIAGRVVVRRGAEVPLLVVDTAPDQGAITLEATWVRAVDGTELPLTGLYTWDGRLAPLPGQTHRVRQPEQDPIAVPATYAIPTAAPDEPVLVARVAEDFFVALRPSVVELSLAR